MYASLRRLLFAVALGCSIIAGAGLSQPAVAQAVTKTIDAGVGVNGTYWRIWWVNVNLETGKIVFGIKGYLDRPTWVAGKAALSERIFTMDIPAGAGTTTWNVLVSAMRDFVKTQPEFSGAADAT